VLVEYMQGRMTPELFASSIVAFVVAITIHEFAHAYAAYRAGDDTAKLAGRVSLNPVDHLDPVGTILILLGGFGWGKPVPVNDLRLRRWRWHQIAVAAAGPGSNIATAAVLAGVWHILSRLSPTGYPSEGAALLLLPTIGLSLALAVFNLIPVFPLDGHHIVGGLLPARMSEAYGRGLGGPQWGMTVLFLLVVTRTTHVMIDPAVTFCLGVLGMG